MSLCCHPSLLLPSSWHWGNVFSSVWATPGIEARPMRCTCWADAVIVRGMMKATKTPPKNNTCSKHAGTSQRRRQKGRFFRLPLFFINCTSSNLSSTSYNSEYVGLYVDQYTPIIHL